MKQTLSWVIHKFGLVSLAFTLLELIARAVEKFFEWGKALELKFDPNKNEFVVQEAI